MTLNEDKLMELEKAVQAQLDAVDYTKKGCFGSLLYSEADDYCVGCADNVACKAAMLKSEDKLIAEFDEAAKAAEAVAVDKELADEVLNPKPVEKPVELTVEPSDAEYVPGGNDRLRERKAEVDGVTVKIKSKIKVDWNAVVAEVMGKKPESYSDMAAVVKGFVHKDYASSAYNWTGKLIDGLTNQGAISYNPKEKVIAWHV